MLGANLGLLLYGEVSVMDRFDFGQPDCLLWTSLSLSAKTFSVGLYNGENVVDTIVRILIKLADNHARHKIELRSHWYIDFRVTCPWAPEYVANTIAPTILIESSDNKDRHKILDKIDFRPTRTIYMNRVTYRVGIFPIDLQTRKYCRQGNGFIFNRIFKFIGSQDRCKTSNESKFGVHPSIYFRVTCPWVLKKIPILLLENCVCSLACSVLIRSSANILFFCRATCTRSFSLPL